MNKRYLHHIWRYFRKAKAWYFLAVMLASGLIAVFALRANNQHMVQLRAAVYQADKDDKNVTQALNDLRSYVYAHMNTNLVSGADAVYPPIQLKYTYDRLVTAESTRTAAVNTQVYTAAQTYCQQLYPDSFSGGPRVPCITDYVNTHGTKSQPIPDGLYKFSFVSPAWSPDLAGWSLVVAVLDVGLFLLALVVQYWFKKHVA